MPVRERAIDLDGTRLHYLERGTGEPLLFLHGVNAGAGIWRELIGRLPAGRRAVAPDLPGWGLTPPPAGFRYEIGELTGLMLRVMDRLELERTTLVGWSFGGCLAAHLAVTAPERVERLVLVAPGGLEPAVHWSYRALCVPGLGEWLMRATPANIRAGMRAVTKHPERVPPAFLSYIEGAAGQPWFTRTTLNWVRRNRVIWEGARRICVGDRLGEIRCPTLVIWGEDDPLVPAEQTRLARAIPDVRVELLPDTGHIPHYEQPDRFFALLSSFCVGEQSDSADGRAG